MRHSFAAGRGDRGRAGIRRRQGTTQVRRVAGPFGDHLAGADRGGQEQGLAQPDRDRDSPERTSASPSSPSTIVNRSGSPTVGGSVEGQPLQGEVVATAKPLAGPAGDRLGRRSPSARPARPRSRSIRATRRCGAGRGLPSGPTRFQSWSRNVASDICWNSASTTPAPIAWTVPAGIRMQSPAAGRERVQQRLDRPGLDRLGHRRRGSCPA